MLYLFISLMMLTSSIQADELQVNNVLVVNFLADTIEDGNFYKKEPIIVQSSILKPLENGSLYARVSSKGKNVIDALTYEYCGSGAVCITVGSHDIYHGFFGTSDDVGITGMGILPQGVYNYNFIDSAFSTANGISLSKTNKFKDALVKTTIQWGVPYVQNNAAFERAIFSNEDKYHAVKSPEVLTISTSAFIGRSHELLANWTRTDIDISNDVKAPSSVKLAHFKTGSNGYYLNQDPDYKIDITRAGYKYSSFGYEFIAEAYRLDVHNATLSIKGSEGYYTVVNFYGAPYTPFIGFTQAKQDQGKKNSDMFFGYSLEDKDWILTADLHLFDAASWVKDSADPTAEKDFFLFSLSYAYRF